MTQAYTYGFRELDRQKRRADVIQKREAAARQKQEYLAARQAETHKLSESVAQRIAALTSLVASAARRRSWALDFGTLKEAVQLPEFDPMGTDHPLPTPIAEVFMPKSPNRLLRALFPKGTVAYRREVAKGVAAYQDAVKRYERGEASRIARRSQLMAEHEARCAAEQQRVALQHDAVEAFRQQYLADHPIAIAKYFKTVLELDKLPDGIPRNIECRYSADGELLIARRMPPDDIIPTPLSYRYIKTRDEIQMVPRSVAQRDELYDKLIAQLIIRSLYIVFASDSRGQVKGAQLDPIFEDHTASPDGSENGLSGSTWCTAAGLATSLKEADYDPIPTIRALRRRQDYKAHIVKLLLKRHGLPLHWEIVGQMAMESYPTIFESRRAMLQILQDFPELFEPQGNGVFGLQR